MKQRLKAWGDNGILPIVGLFAFNEDGELLLLQRHTKDLGGGKWGTPGGRFEKGETAEQAIAREFHEETGLKGFKMQQLGAHHITMPHGTVHITSFMTTVPVDVKVTLDPFEHHAYQWFKVDNLINQPDILYGVPSILRDFKLLSFTGDDPTLADGSSVKRLRLG